MNVWGLYRIGQQLWTPKPGTVTVGPQTLWPVGMTGGQLIMCMVNTKSYSISSSLASGNTIDRTAPANAVSFILAPPPAFGDTVFSGLANAAFQLNFTVGAPAYLYNGLFYPQLRVVTGDGMSQATTDATGAPAGTVNIFGAPGQLFVDFNSPPSTAVTIVQNTVF